ncbi:MAG: hypothetical protein ACXWJX_02355 [Limisphaerales bacterium]
MSAAVIDAGQPAVAVRKCEIQEVFDRNFIELLMIVPRNPYVRGLILKLTGKLPPLECETFEQTKEWVETTCERKPRVSSNRTQRNNREGISISVDFAETECGRADYSVRRYGQSAFEINEDDLLEIVQCAIDAEDGLDEIVEVVAGKIDDDAWEQCEPSMDDYGDYNYDDHENTDSRDSEITFSRTDIRERVLAFLRDRYPGLAQQL